MNHTPTVAIIGGGFCGTAALIQLTKQSYSPIHLVLINKENPAGRGIAFSSYNSNHVLNVPAAKMSLYPDDPDNFINWIRSKVEYKEFVNDELNDRFMPRIMYGHYLEENFKNVVDNLSGHISVKIINDEVIDLAPGTDSTEVILKNNESFVADKVILALGNFTPEDPRIKNKDFINSSRYFNNPWKKDAVEGLDKNDSILIIGSGLTMVDKVLSLLDRDFDGKVYALSTNGYFPLSHKKRKPYTEILEELHPPYDISSLYTIFRKHIKYVLSHGITGEAVVDAVRPKTQEIWLSLSLNDKNRFMAHIRHLWGVARHRLPKDIYDRMQLLISEGKLEIIGARIQDMEENNDKVKVTYKERKSQSVKELLVERVINCTGPRTNLNRIDDPLIVNLLKRGLIAPDEMKLGINALPDGTVIHKDNSLSLQLFTMGSLLKGILWESTAVPELRMQARSLANELIKQLEHQKEIKSI